MKTVSFLSTRLFIFFCALAGPALAAQGNAEPVPRPVSVRIVQLTGKPEGLYLQGEPQIRCQLSQRRISAPADTTLLGNTLRFYRKVDQPATEGGEATTGYQLAAEAVLPAEGKNFLLLFTQDPGSDGTYRVIALPRDELAGRSGQVILYNLSSYPLVGQSAEEQFRIERGNATTIRPGVGRNNNLSLRLARYANDNWELAFSTVWGSNPKLNTLFFIYDAQTGKDAIDVRRFYDAPVAAMNPAGS